ncbi:MAG: PaaI family thioesterase [Proteobacteria bacterium]|nr:PaaI family thioesterase [Pseudomonadota bacterium]
MIKEKNAEFAREFQKKIPFVGHLGIEVDSIGDGKAVLSVTVKPGFTNSFGTAHGGLIMSIMDVALCTAARSQHADSIGVITIDISMQFIGVGKDKLIAEARVLKPGRNTVFTEGEIRNTDGSLVAKGIGTVRVRTAEKEK